MELEMRISSTLAKGLENGAFVQLFYESVVERL